MKVQYAYIYGILFPVFNTFTILNAWLFHIIGNVNYIINIHKRIISICLWHTTFIIWYHYYMDGPSLWIILSIHYFNVWKSNMHMFIAYHFQFIMPSLYGLSHHVIMYAILIISLTYESTISICLWHTTFNIQYRHFTDCPITPYCM